MNNLYRPKTFLKKVIKESMNTVLILNRNLVDTPVFITLTQTRFHPSSRDVPCILFVVFRWWNSRKHWVDGHDVGITIRVG